MTAELSPGTRVECDESREGGEGTPTPLWEAHPRFTAVVDSVQDDYVEATVMTGNGHPRTPDFGSQLSLSADNIDEREKWRVKE